MNRLVFAIPGDIDTISGGYAYDRRLIAGLPAKGWAVDHLPLAADFPAPSAESLTAADAAFARLDAGTVLLVDGLALAAMPEIVVRHAARLVIAALVHHPLSLETGLDPARAADFALSEREALRHCRHVVVTSPETARILVADFGVPGDGVTVAEPGTEPYPPARGDGKKVHLVSVGTLIPRKGHDLLIAALGGLQDLDWRATIVGGDTADPVWAARLRDDAATCGLSDRIAFTGASRDSRAVMADADVFVLPSRYEGYGMVFAEAMGQGLPVVACAAGAVPEVVPPAAGVLVPVDDVAALREALRRLISDTDHRAAMAAGSLAHGRTLAGWGDTAATVARCLATILAAAQAIPRAMR